METFLFKAKLDQETSFDGEWDYFCEGGVGYRDHHRNSFAWKVIDGVVMFRSLSGALSGGGKEVWSPDSKEAQLAYQQYVAKLVTEETADAADA